MYGVRVRRRQVMLKQDSGELACVAERPKRYTLNETKEVRASSSVIHRAAQR